MTERQPPRVATWILEHAVVDPSSTMLAGDLVEMYQDGRSRHWYVTQVAFAVLTAVVRQAQRQRILTLRAFAATFIGANAWWSLLLAVAVSPGLPLAAYYGILVAWAFGFVGVGWIVGRLHPTAHLAGVVAFVIIVLALTSATQILVVRSTFGLSGNRMLRWWVVFGLRQWLWTGSLVVGALLSADATRSKAGGQLSAKSRRIPRADS